MTRREIHTQYIPPRNGLRSGVNHNNRFIPHKRDPIVDGLDRAHMVPGEIDPASSLLLWITYLSFAAAPFAYGFSGSQDFEAPAIDVARPVGDIAASVYHSVIDPLLPSTPHLTAGIIRKHLGDSSCNGGVSEAAFNAFTNGRISFQELLAAGASIIRDTDGVYYQLGGSSGGKKVSAQIVPVGRLNHKIGERVLHGLQQAALNGANKAAAAVGQDNLFQTDASWVPELSEEDRIYIEERCGGAEEGGNITNPTLSPADIEQIQKQIPFYYPEATPIPPNQPLVIAPDRLVYGTLLAGGVTAVDAPLVEDLAFKKLTENGWMFVKSNKGAGEQVFYHPSMDKFLKINLSGKPAAGLITESLQMRAGVEHAFGLSAEEAANWVRLVKIPGGPGQEFLAVESRYLGVNVGKAVQEGMIRADELPQLFEELYDTSMAIARKTNKYNMDLNAGNVLLAIDPKTGARKLIIIDWAKSMNVNAETQTISSMAQATALRKFMRSLPIKDREKFLSTIYANTGKVELRTVLAELGKRENITSFAKAGAKGALSLGLTIVALALSAEDVEAAMLTAAQEGGEFHMDIAYLPLIQSGVDKECADIGSRIAEYPGENGFDAISSIPITTALADQWKKVLDEKQGIRNKLILYNFYDQARPTTGGFQPGFTPVFTGIDVGYDPAGNLAMFRTGTDELLKDGDEVLLFTTSRNNQKERGIEVYKVTLKMNSTTDSHGNINPFTLANKRLIFFMPIQ